MRPLILALTILAGCAQPAPTPATTDTDNPDLVPFVYPEVPLTGFVDPMVGTAGSGNTIPGALVPHGMVRASPDTLADPGAIDAYRWEDTRIEGFTHTNLEGPGGSFNGYSQILLLPQSGDLIADRTARAAIFDHATESAHPGYYGVMLGPIHAELTATSHAAVHRYTFPAGPARLFVDVGHSLGISEDGALHISGSHVTGHGVYLVHPYAAALTGDDGRNGFTTVYTSVLVSVPPTAHGTFDGKDQVVVHDGATDDQGAWIGGYVGWTFAAPTTVEVEVGISYISEDQAQQNVDAEIDGADFDTIATRADATWNHALNRVVVDGTDAQKKQFYTALYRSTFQPADHTEAGGHFATLSGGSAHVRSDAGLRFMTDDWCEWDSFRTVHPLGTLLEPDLRDDIARSDLVMYEEGGWLDKCSWSATGYSRVMIANPTVPILTDMLRKGLDRFDTDEAWDAIDKSGTEETPDTPRGLCGFASLGTPPEYLSLGFVPFECDPSQSASITLEEAVDDAAASRFAQEIGRTADADRYAALAGNWKNTFDATLGFARPRHADGSWVEPFTPTDDSEFNGFTEATSWIYSFHVQEDMPGLIAMMGGRDAFIARLDAFFDGGHFDVSNEPSFHIPWLYAVAGDPAGTQQRVRDTLASSFSTAPGGLPGNDDAGATSAWIVLATLGLYQVDPSDPVWTITTPAVTHAEIRLHPGYYDGGSFIIDTVGDPATMPYIASATFNDAPLDHASLTHDQITHGGTLTLTLSETPTTWGTTQ